MMGLHASHSAKVNTPALGTQCLLPVQVTNTPVYVPDSAIIYVYEYTCNTGLLRQNIGQVCMQSVCVSNYIYMLVYM